jgi:hypothetical protein
MIGNEQAVGADKTAGTAGIEADAGFLQMIEPGVAGVELITLAEDGAGRLIEEPHALVGPGCHVGQY